MHNPYIKSGFLREKDPKLVELINLLRMFLEAPVAQLFFIPKDY